MVQWFIFLPRYVISILLLYIVYLALRISSFLLSVVFGPTFFLLRAFLGINIDSVDIAAVEPEKWKQSISVAFFILLIPLSMSMYLLGLFYLLFPLTTLPMLLYIYFIFTDKAPESGSRTPFLRYWKFWRHFANYFPMRLVKTKDLPPEGKYVFCYHPHGVISVGAFGNFATDATGFSKKFPGIDIRVLTLGLNFYAPFTRELLLSCGLCSASRKSCDQILQRGEGSAIMLVVGGAAESLDAAPGTYRLTLSRQGFVRVALDNDAALVPVLGFGETDVFDTYVYGKNSMIRWLQVLFKNSFGFTLPVFHGIGIFNTSFGILPHRKPVIAVVGPPVYLPKVPEHLKGRGLFNTAEGRQLVTECHNLYIRELVKLYQDFKNAFSVNRSESLRIVGKRLHQH